MAAVWEPMVPAELTAVAAGRVWGLRLHPAAAQPHGGRAGGCNSYGLVSWDVRRLQVALGSSAPCACRGGLHVVQL